MTPEMKDLLERQGNIIHNTCNTIGCKDCGLKNGFDDNSGCASTDLHERIMDLEMKESNHE